MATKKDLMFISYSSSDKEFVDRLKNALEYEENDKSVLSLDIVIDEHIVKAGDFIDKKIFLDNIDECNYFLLVISNESLKSKWVEIEYSHALEKINSYALEKIKAKKKKLSFIPLLIEDLNDVAELPFPLKGYKYIDFRHPSSFLQQLNTLLFHIYPKKENSVNLKIEKLIYKLSIEPNIEILRYKQLIANSLEEKLIEHFEPMKKSIDMIGKIHQASDRIMTLEAIADAEKNANNSIWIVTTHLNNDVLNKEIRESVKTNIEKPIEYKYFVPKTRLIKVRIKEYKEIYQTKEEKSQPSFIHVEEHGLIMPFAEVVIYDPKDSMNMWGYVQLSYDDKTTDQNSVFLRIPIRNLYPLISSLEYQEMEYNKEQKEKENTNKEGGNIDDKK